MQAIAEEHGGSAFEWATAPEDRSRLWKARHDAYYAAMALAPGQAGVRHRRLRADLAARRLRAGDPGRRRRRPGSSRRSSATSATAISTWCVLFDPGSADERAKAEGARQARQPARDRDGRHLHRRARHRRPQARRAGRRARRGRRPDAHDQARARSAQHHESRQDGSDAGAPVESGGATVYASTSATRTTRRGRCAAGSRRSSRARLSRRCRSSSAGEGPTPANRAFSPSGLVPCLHDGDVVVWDSLAIAEYLAERHPGHVARRSGGARVGALDLPRRCIRAFRRCATR